MAASLLRHRVGGQSAQSLNFGAGQEGFVVTPEPSSLTLLLTLLLLGKCRRP